MKLLWVNANFLHPTTKGGQIRTLEMMRRLQDIQGAQAQTGVAAPDGEAPRTS